MITIATFAGVYAWLGIGLIWYMTSHDIEPCEKESGWTKWMEEHFDETTLGIIGLFLVFLMFLLWPLMILMPILWRRGQPTSE
jgi:hypothetical protein